MPFLANKVPVILVEILSEIFNHSYHEWWDEEELYGIADGSGDAATGQFGATLDPEPARWHGIAPAHDAYDKANNSRRSTQTKCQRRRVFQKIQAPKNKCDGTDKLKYPKKYWHN